jgi:hypothetical protein
LVRVVALGLVAVVLCSAPPASSQTEQTTGVLSFGLDAAARIGETNPALVGFGANRFPLGSAEARDALRPLAPRTMRLDAEVHELFDCDAGALDPTRLAELHGRIDGIVDLGAEPLLILAYMPPCLAATMPGDPRSPRNLPPRDPARWEAVVQDLVSATGPGRTAAGRQPVRYYEVWNEPDIPVFFQGTPAEFVDGVALPAGRAVAEVAASSGLDLRYGVCGCFTADPAFLAPIFSAARSAGVPVDFVSWHYYTTLGPDGAEPGFPEAIQLFGPLAEHPLNGPMGIGPEAELVRSLARSLLGTEPELIIDEWNLSGGGFDLRNDTHEGAAFQAAGLAAMADAGLHRGALFNGIDKDDLASDGSQLPDRYGGWGVLDRQLARKPAWYAHWMWHQLGPDRLSSPQYPLDGVWTAAATDGAGIQVLAASYQPNGGSDRVLDIALSGLAPGRYVAERYAVDRDHPGSTSPVDTPVITIAEDGTGRLELPLPAQSVGLVRIVAPPATPLDAAPPAARPPGAAEVETLPATGPAPTPVLAAVLALGAVGARWAIRPRTRADQRRS